ncbi:MAG: hypothetical protein ACXIVE_04080 [Salinarimonas sp.]
MITPEPEPQPLVPLSPLVEAADAALEPAFDPRKGDLPDGLPVVDIYLYPVYVDPSAPLPGASAPTIRGNVFDLTPLTYESRDWFEAAINGLSNLINMALGIETVEPGRVTVARANQILQQRNIPLQVNPDGGFSVSNDAVGGMNTFALLRSVLQPGSLAFGGLDTLAGMPDDAALAAAGFSPEFVEGFNQGRQRMQNEAALTFLSTQAYLFMQLPAGIESGNTPNLQGEGTVYTGARQGQLPGTAEGRSAIRLEYNPATRTYERVVVPLQPGALATQPGGAVVPSQGGPGSLAQQATSIIFLPGTSLDHQAGHMLRPGEDGGALAPQQPGGPSVLPGTQALPPLPQGISPQAQEAVSLFYDSVEGFRNRFNEAWQSAPQPGFTGLQLGTFDSNAAFEAARANLPEINLPELTMQFEPLEFPFQAWVNETGFSTNNTAGFTTPRFEQMVLNMNPKEQQALLDSGELSYFERVFVERQLGMHDPAEIRRRSDALFEEIAPGGDFWARRRMPGETEAEFQTRLRETGQTERIMGQGLPIPGEIPFDQLPDGALGASRLPRDILANASIPVPYIPEVLEAARQAFLGVFSFGATQLPGGAAQEGIQPITPQVPPETVDGAPVDSPIVHREVIGGQEVEFRFGTPDYPFTVHGYGATGAEGGPSADYNLLQEIHDRGWQIFSQIVGRPVIEHLLAPAQVVTFRFAEDGTTVLGADTDPFLDGGAQRRAQQEGGADTNIIMGSDFQFRPVAPDGTVGEPIPVTYEIASQPEFNVWRNHPGYDGDPIVFSLHIPTGLSLQGDGTWSGPGYLPIEPFPDPFGETMIGQVVTGLADATTQAGRFAFQAAYPIKKGAQIGAALMAAIAAGDVAFNGIVIEEGNLRTHNVANIPQAAYSISIMSGGRVPFVLYLGLDDQRPITYVGTEVPGTPPSGGALPRSQISGSGDNTYFRGLMTTSLLYMNVPSVVLEGLGFDVNGETSNELLDLAARYARSNRYWLGFFAGDEDVNFGAVTFGQPSIPVAGVGRGERLPLGAAVGGNPFILGTRVSGAEGQPLTYSAAASASLDLQGQLSYFTLGPVRFAVDGGRAINFQGLANYTTDPGAAARGVNLYRGDGGQLNLGGPNFNLVPITGDAAYLNTQATGRHPLQILMELFQPVPSERTPRFQHLEEGHGEEAPPTP